MYIFRLKTMQKNKYSEKEKFKNVNKSISNKTSSIQKVFSY